jgi:hypothetical protein
MAGPTTRGFSGLTSRLRNPLAACATVSYAGRLAAGPLAPKPLIEQ